MDSLSLCSSIRFGFYDAILNGWKGKIKVISTMGKQSTGKSYLLNHLSGSFLDVAGCRCTDGVWMTIATKEGDSSCLYVLLDFEGFGSFERSEQEDMLLSVLSAAVSNITILNKKDFSFDKDTESSFRCFQRGINLIKQDKKLFKGLLYIAIKDVDRVDVEDLMGEFNKKLRQLCLKYRENFISKMYDGQFQIAPMAHYIRSDYYTESLLAIAESVHEIDSCYDNGSAFLRDLKLIIAQIAAKDWTSIDTKRVALIVDILKRNLISAVIMGCLCNTHTNNMQTLVNFVSQDEVPDLPIVVGDFSYNVRDSGLCLAASKESPTSISIRDVLCKLKSLFESFLPRIDNNGENWHSSFEKFLEALVQRRYGRVKDWIESNTVDFGDNDEVKNLRFTVDAALAELRYNILLCGRKCSVCYWRCLLEKGHDHQQFESEHSCMGTHSCTESCTYCARKGDSLSPCKDLAGHQGPHNCKDRNHACEEVCHLFEMSSNCNQLCSLPPKHPGQHKCNSPQHMCKTSCSLPSCNNPCILSVESKHEKHQCHERYCQSKCTISGCYRTCRETDHFHSLDPYAEHFCGKEHACPEKCEMPGICEIITKLVRQTSHYMGQRGSFPYERVSDQTGLRKDCCIPIPPFERSHKGLHVHTRDAESVHYCDKKCQGCGYFCHFPVNHHGLHDTVHGNMKNVRFTSEKEDIEIQGRKYKWGETGDAELCDVYCRKQGRGHIHLIICPEYKSEANLGLDPQHGMCTSNFHDGSRHQTVQYGPDIDIPKDEMTHETYWHYIGFVDPCTQEEQQEFGSCNHYCKFAKHSEGVVDEGLAETETEYSGDRSYCTEKMLHSPVSRTEEDANSTGYISTDGHHFSCRHSINVPHHIIFVIDKSTSMAFKDITPTMPKFSETNNCRLGCVYEGILKFIQTRRRTFSGDSVSMVLFHKCAELAVEMQDMEEAVVDILLQFQPAKFFNWGAGLDQFKKVTRGAIGDFLAGDSSFGVGTHYTAGLDAAEQIMLKASRDCNVDMKIPVVIFLSDGGNNGSDPLPCLERMKRIEPRMVLHTIMYSKHPPKSILQEMAEKGGGSCHVAVDEVQLGRAFEFLARRTSVASYICDN